MQLKKYEMLTDTTLLNVDGHLLRKIRAVRPIPEKGVKVGDVGGWIESEKNLSHDGTSWVADEAMVMGDGYVCGNALVKDKATVNGITTIIDDATVGGKAMVLGHCYIAGQAKVSGNAILEARIVIDGTAYVTGDTTILCDWCQHAGKLKHFNWEDIEGICNGIGGSYGRAGMRLHMIQQKMEEIDTYLQGLKDYVDVKVKGIANIEDNGSYKKLMEDLDKTTLLIRNTKDISYSQISNWQTTICRFDKKGNFSPTIHAQETQEETPKITVTPMRSHAKTAQEKAAAYQRSLARKRAQYAADRARDKEIIEMAMKDTNVRKNLK